MKKLLFMFLAGFCFAECILPAACGISGERTIQVPRARPGKKFTVRVEEIKGYSGSIRVRGVNKKERTIQAFIRNSPLTIKGVVPKSGTPKILVDEVYNLKGARLNYKCAGKIDIEDLVKVRSKLGDTPRSQACREGDTRFFADINSDGRVDTNDLLELLNEFAKPVCEAIECNVTIILNFVGRRSN